MRRRTALVMLWVAGAAAAVAALATIATVARFAAFRPLAHPFLTIFIAGIVAGVAAHHALRPGTPRLLTQVAAGVLGLAAAGAGVVWYQFGEVFAPQDPTVVAGGSTVQVIAWYDHFDGEMSLRLRSRAGPFGLLSRDGPADLARFDEPWTVSGPPSDAQFASATVSGDTLVATTTDGQQWRVTFDPETLRPTGPLIDRRSPYPD